ncbi:MAG: hypothetical protein WBN92_01720 [Terriglobia bacterium]
MKIPATEMKIYLPGGIPGWGILWGGSVILVFTSLVIRINSVVRVPSFILVMLLTKALG